MAVNAGAALAAYSATTTGRPLDRLGRVFGQDGVRRRTSEDQTNQASCLNLVTNAVFVWNTVYMKAAIDRLVEEGAIGTDVDLSHLSPGLHEHVDPYGRYRFDVDDAVASGRLRPLRLPEAATP